LAHRIQRIAEPHVAARRMRTPARQGAPRGPARSRNARSMTRGRGKKPTVTGPDCGTCAAVAPGMTDDERALWEHLMAEQPIPDVKALPLGLAAWLRHHPGEACRLVVARAAGQPVAVAPLAATPMPGGRPLARPGGGARRLPLA